MKHEHKCEATKEGDVEDVVPIPASTEYPTFDGFWDAWQFPDQPREAGAPSNRMGAQKQHCGLLEFARIWPNQFFERGGEAWELRPVSLRCQIAFKSFTLLRKPRWLMETALAAPLSFYQVPFIAACGVLQLSIWCLDLSFGALCGGKNVWHDGSQFASIKVLNQQTCALIMDDDDVRGYLSADGQEIEWEDGDCWKRAEKHERHNRRQADQVHQVPLGPTCTRHNEAADSVKESDSTGDAGPVLDALLQRDAGALERILTSSSADISLPPEPVWEAMQWTPKGDDCNVPLPLIVAAILLEWPEGVRICVEKNANVNATFAGPFRGSDGRTVQDRRVRRSNPARDGLSITQARMVDFASRLPYAVTLTRWHYQLQGQRKAPFA
eukprot:Skav225144  [mRNA]  locus=scaffold1056:206633:208533:- [translate_table: standard]